MCAKICWVESTGAMKETAKEDFSFSVVPHTPVIIGHFMVSLCFFALLFPFHLPLAWSVLCPDHISIFIHSVLWIISTHLPDYILLLPRRSHLWGGGDFFLIQIFVGHSSCCRSVWPTTWQTVCIVCRWCEHAPEGGVWGSASHRASPSITRSQDMV